MSEETLELKIKAEHYRNLYNSGLCTREEAKINIMPYLDFVNSKAKEIAKKYNKRPRGIIGLAYYLR